MVAISQANSYNSTKVKQHIANVAATTAGIGAGTLVAYKGSIYTAANARGKYKMLNDISDAGAKIGGLFNKIGEKLIRKDSITADILERLSNIKGSVKSKEMLKQFKGSVVVGIVGAVIVLTSLLKGFYRAGKINGEGK